MIAMMVCGIGAPANEREAMWYSFESRMFDRRSVSMICACVQSKLG